MITPTQVKQQMFATAVVHRDPLCPFDPEGVLYLAELHVGQRRIQTWEFDRPEGVPNGRPQARWTVAFVAEKVRTLFTDRAEVHFGPRDRWSPELLAILEIGDADLSARCVTLHPRDVPGLVRYEVEADRQAVQVKRDDPQSAGNWVASQRCTLYRHYDPDGVLLYIGITKQPGQRDVGHRRESVWVEFADQVTAQWLSSREEAAAAERAAIAAEMPVFNKRPAPPGRDDRVRAYLTAKDRLDLLPDAL